MQNIKKKKLLFKQIKYFLWFFVDYVLTDIRTYVRMYVSRENKKKESRAS